VLAEELEHKVAEVQVVLAAEQVMEVRRLEQILLVKEILVELLILRCMAAEAAVELVRQAKMELQAETVMVELD
jgi:hypothetical protein